MAPIPTFSEDALDLIAAARRRQIDLIDVQIPRLRSCTGPLSLQQTLVAELREDVDVFEQQVEELDLCIDDQLGIKAQSALRDVVGEFKGALSGIKRDSRAALLFSKRTIESQRKSQRDELLASSAVKEKTTVNEKVTGNALMKANDNVTEALRRTISLMQGELERSVLTTQMLDSSTASLRSTSSTHDTLTNVMDASKQLITALEKSDWLDRMLIISAFTFFVLVVLLILKQRVLDRGLRIAFWWTKFLPDFAWDAQLLAGGEKGRAITSSVASSVSSVVGTLSAMAATATAAASSSKPTRITGSDGGSGSSLETTYSGVMSTGSLPPEPSHTVSVGGERTLHADEL